MIVGQMCHITLLLERENRRTCAPVSNSAHEAWIYDCQLWS